MKTQEEREIVEVLGSLHSRLGMVEDLLEDGLKQTRSMDGTLAGVARDVATILKELGSITKALGPHFDAVERERAVAEQHRLDVTKRLRVLESRAGIKGGT